MVSLLKKDSIFFSFTAIWCAHLILDFMLGIWPVYKTLAHLDIAKAGWIAGMGMLIGEGSQLFFGLLSDRGYQKKLIVLGLALVSSVAFLAYTSNYVFLFIFMLCTYMGSGSFHPAAIGLVSGWFPIRKGIFIALFASGGMIGEAVGQRLFSYTYHHLNGHTLVMLVPIFLALIWCCRQAFPTQVHSKRPSGSLMEQFKWIAIKKKELCGLYTLQVLVRSVVLAFIFLLPEVLHQRNYEDWFCLGGGHACYIFGSALMSIPAGLLLDHFGSKKVLSIAIACSASFFIFFVFAGSLVLGLEALLLLSLGACTGVISPLIVATGTKLVPQQAYSLVGGLLMGAASCLASLSIIAAGALTNWLGPETPVKALQVIGFLYFPMIYLLKKMHPTPQLSLKVS